MFFKPTSRGPYADSNCDPASVILSNSKPLLSSICNSAMLFSVFSIDSMLIPQCRRCTAKYGSSTMSSSSGEYEYTSAPFALIVPSFTTSG